MVSIAHDYRTGKLAEIVEDCKRDVDSVRQVYRRLTFSNPAR